LRATSVRFGLVLSALLLIAAAPHAQISMPGFEVLETVHFRIFYHAQDALIAESLAGIAESARSQLIGRLPLAEDFRTTVILAGSEKEFRRDYAKALPEWSAAFAVPKANTIVVRSPDDVASAAAFGRVFLHEYTHLVVADILGGAEIPLWFNEGLASYLAGQLGMGRSAALLWGVARGRLYSLDRLSRYYPSKPAKARLAYAESFVAVEFLVENIGWNAVERILVRTRELGSFEYAFSETTALNVAEFEYALFTYLKKRHRNLRLIVESFPFWSALTILFLVAYSVKRIRARRRLARMDGFSQPRW